MWRGKLNPEAARVLSLVPAYPMEISAVELGRRTGLSANRIGYVLRGLPTDLPIAERTEGEKELWLCFPTEEDRGMVMERIRRNR